MWMPTIEPGWAGKVQFWELLFGTWTAYAWLVWFWQRVLKEPLDEWRYVMITFLAAGAFWINHYFQKAPFWLLLLNLYTVLFVLSYWAIAVRGRRRSRGWKLAALLSSLLFALVFVLFEQLARYGVARWGMHEFCWMAISYLGFVWLIWWRGHSSVSAQPRRPLDPHAPQVPGQ